MILTPSELELTRLHPQNTELYLSIFQPNTAMSALVTGTHVRGSYQINYIPTGGSYLAVEAGMTLLIGTSAGGRELGKIRVRSVTPTQIIVSENSNIDWASAVHLTVLRYWELWPVYPRIIKDPGNAENVIFYKDYDIAYTNQNSILGTLQCAGSHLAGWVGDSFYFSNTGTTHLLGSALTHDWAFEGATITGSTSAIPGNITWNTPGHYVVRYKSTGANGSVDTTYRYVSIYNRPSQSSQNIPIQKWDIDTVSGGRDEAGYTTSIRIIEEEVDIHDGDVVVLFSDNWYGGQNTSLGSNTNNPKIFFNGHILNNTIQFDYKKKMVEFEVASITHFMKIMEGFSVSVESKASPSTWFQLLDMDGRRAMYHYLRWHSTLLNISDFRFLGTDQKVQYFDSDRGSIFDAVDNYMRGTLEGKVCADLQGLVYAEVGVQAYTSPTGSFPISMEITKRDWMGEPNIIERLAPVVSFMERGGVAYSGSTTGTFSALISNAPGSTPAFRGSEDKAQGLALASQSQLNILTGNLLAQRNAQFPEIGMRMTGNYRNLDIAPQTLVDMDIENADTNRNIEIHAPYLVDKISWVYNAKNKILIPEISFSAIVEGPPGETVTIPDVATITNRGFNIPGFSIPNLNPLIPTLTTGIRYCGITLSSSDVSNGTKTVDFTVGPNVSRLSVFAGSDPTLFSDPTFPVLANSGIYLIMATPSLDFPTTNAHLNFSNPVLPNPHRSSHTFANAVDTFAWVLTRPVYYNAGQMVSLTINYTGGTPIGGDFAYIDLWVLKLN